MVLILISLFVIEVVVAAALGLGIYYFQFLPTDNTVAAISSSADGEQQLLRRTVARSSDRSGTLPLFQSLFGTANYTSNGSSSPLIITTAGNYKKKGRKAMTSFSMSV